MLNRVELIGHLGADPEIRRTQDGRPIANLSLATGEKWTDRNTGEKRERTEWHRIVVFSEPLAKVVEQYCRKGSRVYLEGKLATHEWTDQQGIKRYTTEVVLQGFDGRLILLDRAERAPPAGEDDYGAARRAPTSGASTSGAPSSGTSSSGASARSDAAARARMSATVRGDHAPQGGPAGAPAFDDDIPF